MFIDFCYVDQETSSTASAFSGASDGLAIAKAGLSITDGHETAKPIQSCQGRYNQGLIIIPPPSPCQSSKDTTSSYDPLHFANSASILF
jgi:hypothetical protein